MKFVSVTSTWNDASGANTHIFTQDLNHRLVNQFPFEDLDVFLDVSRSWLAKTHDEREERLAFFIRFTLRHSFWLESFEVATNPILLLRDETIADE